MFLSIKFIKHARKVYGVLKNLVHEGEIYLFFILISAGQDNIHAVFSTIPNKILLVTTIV